MVATQPSPAPSVYRAVSAAPVGITRIIIELIARTERAARPGIQVLAAPEFQNIDKLTAGVDFDSPCPFRPLPLGHDEVFSVTLANQR
jgi:hypothetical protein